MFYLACLGDLVMDMIPHTKTEHGWLYAPCPGGAPGNVAVGLARLGRHVAMLAKVGDEALGAAIIAALERNGVEISGVSRTTTGKTRLSVIALKPDGDREFLFYRDDPADLLFSIEDINPALIEGASLLHVGGLLMAAPGAAAAQLEAIRIARKAGRLVSVDVNFRPALWPDAATMVRAGKQVIGVSAIVKLSEEELFAMTGDRSIEKSARSLWHDGMQVITVTKGAGGAELFTAHSNYSCNGFAVETIDTTAAGDAFMASLLSGMLDFGPDYRDDGRCAIILRAACAAGALATTKRGAMDSLPTKDEIERLLSQ